MKEIILSQNKVALVDDEDFNFLSQWNWYASKHGNIFYAKGGRYNRNKNLTENIKRMHRVIMERYGVITDIDHIDTDGLNNQKYNLRPCTSSQNAMNRTKRKNTSSIYKGVYFDKIQKQFRSDIYINGNKIGLGRFKIEDDAAMAYNKKALEIFGEFARLNVIIG